MLTTEHVLAAFRMIEAAGFRRPDSLDSPEAIRESAEVWAAVLADMTPEDFQAAVLARLRAGSSFWPTVIEVRGLAPKQRMAALDDAPAAWETVYRWLRGPGRSAIPIERGGTLTGYGYPDPKSGALDPEDDARDAAMSVALERAGGATRWNRGTESDQTWFEKRFLEAYREIRARRQIRQEGGTVLALADRIASPAIAERGGGFKKIGGGK